ncbi:Spo0E family sporulation regulatory protein-aspartic acid phosphatase [Clostridium tetani]|uniref:Spo0E family sporulation regulatory protein-aspartic acid phosphatase n=1 Tax=Clostridium tetani TaxID=1513 RepID=A0ABY0ET93_CLOTA|nr:Spo0E family sporulation regulatory protein-aspartic acid phosphatase [Clostridium tetani]CDI48108.1 hypothetical protein BN906_00032 [Clostridium tetani 12124569]KHO40524.1 hypothetical protein OR62_00120 [Clostridium tetani]RXI38970.1 Spo0E family sporulation regulatory protein-aspartic acid phosphatase [Clostridium tetani]RXI59205.1 Spo0E family sporulation regulatory protein-aspartic acid phosphatase [Clostridium tetani]RXI71300.1 Spo0E family sporulation regulatory protein-aspartic aci
MGKNYLIPCEEKDTILEKEIEVYKIIDIEKEIDYARDMLNEVSCDIDDLEKNEEILKISQYMDRLLNEYFSIVNSNNKI